MIRFPRFLSNIFEASEDIDVYSIGEALNDPTIRSRWLKSMLDEIKRIHLDIDSRLMAGNRDISDLSSRRRAIQFALERLSSERRSALQESRHNQAESLFSKLTAKVKQTLPIT